MCLWYIEISYYKLILYDITTISNQKEDSIYFNEDNYL